MKNGRYFNFRDICNRNLWDTGYLVKNLQGYGILRPPNGASLLGMIILFTYCQQQKPSCIIYCNEFPDGKFV